jgi:D-arabinose 1-dehydrogenase-like Zn-dependent alcohol dehydrogenase
MVAAAATCSTITTRMALVPGIRLGPYDVVGPLGAGGMGEVYRAKDTKLAWSIAID